jgi:hypothetical protein
MGGHGTYGAGQGTTTASLALPSSGLAYGEHYGVSNSTRVGGGAPQGTLGCYGVPNSTDISDVAARQGGSGTGMMDQLHSGWTNSSAAVGNQRDLFNNLLR